MAGLERDAASAVRALAAARTPDDGATERAWLLMQERLVDGPPPLDIGTTPTIAAARARWIATGIAVAALLVLAVGLASWSAGWLAGIDARAPAEAPYSTTREDASQETATIRDAAPVVAEPKSSAVAPIPTEIVEPVPVEPVAIAAPAEPRATKPSNKSARRSEPEPEPSTSIPKTTTLAAEMRLLARANAAMRAGDAAGALAVLDEHARDFAGGQLAPEREYKRALALCELGRADKARAVASAFVKAHPRSPLRAKAQSVCREEESQ
jgi:outer membrane biosynthesis protein TonB